MVTTAEKRDIEQIEVMENAAASQASDHSVEKGLDHTEDVIPNEAKDEDIVTLKTWAVIIVSIAFSGLKGTTDYRKILSASYGLSFWVVTTLGAIQTQVATQLGNPTNAGWWTTV